MSHANLGKTIDQLRDESAKKRQSILNCDKYRSGERFYAYDAAKVLGCSSTATYNTLKGMIDRGQLKSRKFGNRTEYSKPGGDMLKISWRKHSNNWIYR
jgi:hypothetical protein